MRREFILACCVAQLSAGSVQADVGASFPGAAKNFPINDVSDVNVVVDNLYNGHVLHSREPLCQAGCLIEIKDSLAFVGPRGHEHLVIVTAAGPASDAAHSDGAVIGIVNLVKTARGWVIQEGTPVLTTEGTFGSAPEMQLLPGGVFGYALVTMPGSTNQGETDVTWNLYLSNGPGRGYRQALSLPKLHSAACEESDAACRKDDFTTQITVYTLVGGLGVEMTRIRFHGNPETKRFILSPQTDKAHK